MIQWTAFTSESLKRKVKLHIGFTWSYNSFLWLLHGFHHVLEVILGPAERVFEALGPVTDYMEGQIPSSCFRPKLKRNPPRSKG